MESYAITQSKRCAVLDKAHSGRKRPNFESFKTDQDTHVIN